MRTPLRVSSDNQVVLLILPSPSFILPPSSLYLSLPFTLFLRFSNTILSLPACLSYIIYQRFALVRGLLSKLQPIFITVRAVCFSQNSYKGRYPYDEI